MSQLVSPRPHADPGRHATVQAGEEQDEVLVTVVLPCYNEEEHVLDELERITVAMDASGYSYELLVIDDASTDSTRRLVEKALPRYPNLRFMPFQRNGGSGTARRIGTRETRGEIVVWTDADMTYPNDRSRTIPSGSARPPCRGASRRGRTTSAGSTGRGPWGRRPAARSPRR
jgi:cellulose synthase/poly-beta-1,6-N-acetylglucosamine synthase-like glycosyltransferase